MQLENYKMQISKMQTWSNWMQMWVKNANLWAMHESADANLKNFLKLNKVQLQLWVKNANIWTMHESGIT